jgi:hypothetical protein
MNNECGSMMCVPLCSPHVKDKEIELTILTVNSHLFCKPKAVSCEYSKSSSVLPGEITSRCLTASLLLLVLCWCYQATSEGMVVATVHGTELRIAEVDADATARIFALQQQIYTLRKSTLENLISRGYLGLTCDSDLPSRAVYDSLVLCSQKAPTRA